MSKNISLILRLPFLSYLGKKAQYLVLGLIIISVLTLIFMTFNAYKDKGRIIYLKDILLILLLVFSLGFVQYYFIQNIIRPMRNLYLNLVKFVKSEELVGGNPDETKAKDSFEINKLVERINSTMISFDQAKKGLLNDKAELELAINMMAYERKKLQSVLDCLPEALVITDSSGGVVLINSVSEAIFKTSKKDVLGKPLKDLADDKSLKEFLEKNEGTDNRVMSQEIEIGNNGNGIKKSFRVIYDCLKNERGKSLGNALILVDNSHQKMADQMRNSFVSSVSHELRTPLASIKSKIEMLSDGEVKDKDTQTEFYNGINDEIDRLSELINNLLNISKIELGSAVVNKSSVRIKKLLEDSFEMIEPQAVKKGVTLNKNIPDRLSASVELDKQMIQMAINNLLGNAIKYTQKGGSIFLEGEEREKDVIIHVKDTGIGIPEEDQPHVFEEFYRSGQKEVREKPGNGLGLSVVHQIVMLHGGEIKFKSKVGEGTHFTVVLPKERGSVV